MDDNTFYIRCWVLVTIVVLGIIGCITGASIVSKQMTLEMVKAGASPLEAACAAGSFESSNGLCIGVAVLTDH
jgi:hypothetical protein